MAQEHQLVCFLVVNRIQKKPHVAAGCDDEFWLRDVAAQRLNTAEPGENGVRAGSALSADVCR